MSQIVGWVKARNPTQSQIVGWVKVRNPTQSSFHFQVVVEAIHELPLRWIN